MPTYFFDTSALGKHYHAEPGSSEVQRLMKAKRATRLISRLTAVEMHSVFFKKVRVGQLPLAEANELLRRFQRDISSHRLRVSRFLMVDFLRAEKLLRVHGPNRNLRTLDALQLSVALRFQISQSRLQFICADQALVSIAAQEGLKVINPESP